MPKALAGERRRVAFGLRDLVASGHIKYFHDAKSLTVFELFFTDQTPWGKDPAKIMEGRLPATVGHEGIAIMDRLAAEGQDFGCPDIVELRASAPSDDVGTILGEGADPAIKGGRQLRGEGPGIADLGAFAYH